MNFVITGGAGFIGSHLAKFLVENDHFVTIIDNLHRGKIENLSSIKNKIKFEKVDILEYEKLKKIIKNADGVFHEAALTVVKESLTKPKKYYRVNVKGTENIFKLGKEFGFKIVFASSSSVYGNQRNVPIKETSKRRPINPYGMTKLESERLAEKYSQSGVEIIGLRYFNVYGDGQNIAYAGVILKFLEKVTNGKAPIIYGNGLQIRDFISVNDVVRANLMAMESKVKHAFINIGAGIPIQIKELAKTMIELGGLSLEPVYKKLIAGDIKKSLADIRLSRQLINWKPDTKLEDWLNKTIQETMKR